MRKGHMRLIHLQVPKLHSGFEGVGVQAICTWSPIAKPSRTAWPRTPSMTSAGDTYCQQTRPRGAGAAAPAAAAADAPAAVADAPAAAAPLDLALQQLPFGTAVLACGSWVEVK